MPCTRHGGLSVALALNWIRSSHLSGLRISRSPKGRCIDIFRRVIVHPKSSALSNMNDRKIFISMVEEHYRRLGDP